uniref:Immunoglobulin domain-containing protein n=1 Tax=Lates calcarifer TaxID=8187 RepID=A0A4W6DGZ6_LATCA
MISLAVDWLMLFSCTLTDMAVHLGFLLILNGLIGIHSITAVSKVSVRAGDSITIPCLYGSQYRNHVKYLCKGYYWSFCSEVVKTNQPHSSGKFSISDDKTQRIFNVTIKALTNDDTDYWCAVEINQGGDIKKYFHLSVARGTPSLYVDHQEMTGFNGDSVTISCKYTTAGEMKWCRLGGNCVTGSSGSIDGTTVTINSSVRNVFIVTMSGLTTQSSGWYLCVKGDFQMPVHVTVNDTPTTTSLATRRHFTTLSPPAGPVNLTSVSPDETLNSSVSVKLMSYIIPLSVLIFIVMMTLFIWFLCKRNKHTEEESSATATAEEVLTYTTVKHERKLDQAEAEVTYSNVKYTKKPSHKRSVAKSDEEVTYSSVVTTKQQPVQRVSCKTSKSNLTLSLTQSNVFCISINGSVSVAVNQSTTFGPH